MSTDPLSVRMREAARPKVAEGIRCALLDLGADHIDRLEARGATACPALPDVLAILRILRCLDQDELVAGGILDAADAIGWRTFRGEPTAWLLKAADDRRQRLWRMVERRMGRPVPQAVAA